MSGAFLPSLLASYLWIGQFSVFIRHVSCCYLIIRHVISSHLDVSCSVSVKSSSFRKSLLDHIKSHLIK